nr:uncharacterized protein LOC109179592 [Ipomoea batatas]
MNDYCRRPELKRDLVTGKFPKACYTLDKPAREALCEWVKNLKFPDGYVSNMSRCVDMNKLKLFGMKSHDCHVFMQRLIPIAFRELLPLNVWKVLTELSLFFKNLTSTTIRVEEMMKLENDIPLILCQLERLFPPSFFDSMEHLPIHLAYEARIAGPVQYRWMYPFERYLRKLKNNVKNKAKVEGSISNAYLVEEASSFCSYYFEDHASTKHINVPRNADGSEYIVDGHEETLSIFKYSGRAFGKAKVRYMTDEEYKAAQTYVLLNCSEVEPFIEVYIEELKRSQPNISSTPIDRKLENEFANWFNDYAHDPSNNISNKFIKDLAKGPLRSVNTYSGYYVNGFKFHTIGYGGAKETMNTGVCIKGINYSVDESDYYGRLVEVVQVEYPGLPIKRTILFKCEWFDPTSVGMKVHPKYKLVEVNHKRRFNRYESFVLAMQAAQVYYCTYPSLRRDKLDWWAVCKIKARSNVEIPESSIYAEESLIPAPFQEETTDNHDLVQIDEDPLHLDDPNGGVIELDGEHGDIEDEIELEEEIDDSSGDSREELQKEPNLFECFAQMHKKKDGMFVDERSKRIAEQVQARHDVATQEAEDSTESPNINMSQLYVDVVGGAKKQRIYGLGTKGSSFINGNSYGSSATSQLHQDAMKDMMNQQLETMRVDMEAKLQAERNQMQAQMQTQIHTQIQAQITSLMDELRRNGILSTSMPLPPQQAKNSVNSNDENLGDH